MGIQVVSAEQPVSKGCNDQGIFIFELEAVAKIACLAVASEVLSGDVLCFVDNIASEHALRKGCSKESVRLVLVLDSQQES